MLVLTAFLAACDGTSRTADREAFIAAAVDELRAQTWVTDGQATCLITGQVDIHGYDELVAAGVSPEEIGSARIHALSDSMSDAERAAMIRVVPGCGISWAEWFGQGAPTATQRACVAQVASDDELTEAYTSVAGDVAAPENRELVDAYFACFDR